MPLNEEARARELLAAEYDAMGRPVSAEGVRRGNSGWSDDAAVRAMLKFAALQSTPPPPSEDVAGLIARLRRTVWSKGFSTSDPFRELANPDGPEAAAHIEAQEAEIGRLEAENNRLRRAMGTGAPTRFTHGRDGGRGPRSGTVDWKARGDADETDQTP